MLHICPVCRGDGRVCATCGRKHRLRDFDRTCNSRRRVACPGEMTGDGHRPHVDTFTECDVCRVRVAMLGSEARNMLGWASVENPNVERGNRLHLCAPCLKRHGEIQKMTMEYLMVDCGGLRMGEWLDRQGKLLPQTSILKATR